jgi:hypothetical protein
MPKMTRLTQVSRDMEMRMIRFGQISWQACARLVALGTWALALALTGGMGWQAWTALQDSANYGYSQIDTALISRQSTIDALLIDSRKRVAR